MLFNSIGFIGGGRITRIMLQGFQNAGLKFEKVVVSDTSPDNLKKLKDSFPGICISHNDNEEPARQDLVLIALHPPVIMDILNEIKTALNPGAVLISLAPKITLAKMSAQLGGFSRIARMNPAATSIANAGFNPVCFSDAISEKEKSELLKVLVTLGDTPEVAEEKIEAYALFTAMGPTYFWFQFYNLQKIITSFGLSTNEFQEGLTKMLNGSLKTMFSGISPEEVMDLVPVKPIGEAEASIKELYSEKLNTIYNKIKP